jgi:hypothetical protein
MANSVEAGLTPQMAIVNADGTPTMFFFRWLLASRSGLLTVGDLEILEAIADGALDAALAENAAGVEEALSLAWLIGSGAAPRERFVEAAMHAALAGRAFADAAADGDRRALETFAAEPAPRGDAAGEIAALEALLAAPAPVSVPVVPRSAAVVASNASADLIAATLPNNDIWVGNASNAPTPTPLSSLAGAPPLAAQIAYASANTALAAGSYTDLTGAALTITGAGTYLVTGIFDFYYAAADGATTFQGALSVVSALQPEVAVLTPATNDGFRAMIGQQWIIAAAAGTILQLAAAQTAGTGASLCLGAGGTTMISAIRVA